MSGQALSTKEQETVLRKMTSQVHHKVGVSTTYELVKSRLIIIAFTEFLSEEQSKEKQSKPRSEI